MLNQNRNAVCGQHKEEVLKQLQELAKVGTDSNEKHVDAAESHMGFRSIVPEQSLQPERMYIGFQYNTEAKPITVPTYEVKLSYC